jgi:hypothetical protein
MCSSSWRQLINPPAEGKHLPPDCEQLLPRPTVPGNRTGPGPRDTPMPGECMGPAAAQRQASMREPPDPREHCARFLHGARTPTLHRCARPWSRPPPRRSAGLHREDLAAGQVGGAGDAVEQLAQQHRPEQVPEGERDDAGATSSLTPKKVLSTSAWPSPMTASQCQRDQGSRSSRPGIRVSRSLSASRSPSTSRPPCPARSVTRAAAEQTRGPVAWDG